MSWRRKDSHAPGRPISFCRPTGAVSPATWLRPPPPVASVKIGGVKIAGSLRLRLAFSQSNAKSNVSLSLRRQQGDMDWGVPAFPGGCSASVYDCRV